MEIIRDFYSLDAWQKGQELILAVYRLTRVFPNEELYGLTNQLRRAAGSINANIAEGFGRYHFKDKARFYYQARGSVLEVQNHLLLARDLGFISAETYLKFKLSIDKVRQLINGLIRSIEKQK